MNIYNIYIYKIFKIIYLKSYIINKDILNYINYNI